MVLSFGVGKECSLGSVVREGLIEIRCRVRPGTSEGASHEKRLGMELGGVGKNVPGRGNRISNTSERGKSLVYLRNWKVASVAIIGEWGRIGREGSGEIREGAHYAWSIRL